MHRQLNEKLRGDSVVIATRELEYSLKDSEKKYPLIVTVRSPVCLKSTHGVDAILIDAYCCLVEFSAVIPDYVCYGIDEIQVLSFATNINPALIGFRDKYDFFLPDDECGDSRYDITSNLIDCGCINPLMRELKNES